MTTYFQSTRAGYVRLYHTPFDSFWCCTGSGLENHARYGETIYSVDSSGVLHVNLFMSSTLEWRERGITLAQETRFPDSDRTRLTFTAGKPQNVALAIRHPAWCRSMKISVNGRLATSSGMPGRYAQVERRFRRGDVIEVHTPMELRLEPLP
jgi:DUF1680 family protein